MSATASLRFSGDNYVPSPQLRFGVVDDGGSGGSAVASFAILLRATAAFTATYDIAVRRYRERGASLPYERAGHRDSPHAAAHSQSRSAAPEFTVPWTVAEPLRREVTQRLRSSAMRTSDAAAPWSRATPQSADPVSVAWDSLTAMRAGAAIPWSTGRQLTSAAAVTYNNLLQRLMSGEIPWQEAARLSAGSLLPAGDAHRVFIDPSIPWNRARPPQPGRSLRPDDTIDDHECYAPDPALRFSAQWDGSANLLFVCPRPDPGTGTVVVPIRRVYMVFNEFSLVRWPDGAPIPATGLSMTLDADSWAWSFQASVPGVALPLLEAVDGKPVTLRATINGSPFHWLAQSISRSRSFANSTLTVSGRSVLSTLDSPNSPAIDYLQAEALTVRQLIDDVLSYNGVPLGVPVEFDLDDWLVPAKTFSHSGTYIAAVAALAAAGGGYVQPHDTDLALRVRHRYPFMPRDWASSVTPDFVLPSAVTTREGIEWSSRPEFNRIFLEGSSLAQITSVGTAGDVPAPGIVEPLLTAPAGWLQRGRAELGAGGRYARVNLSLPVLAETGIIRPGHWVSYVDGIETRLGLVRGVTVQVGMPTIMQNLDVETRILE